MIRLLFLIACTEKAPQKLPSPDTTVEETGDSTTTDSADSDTGIATITYDPWPFVDAVVSYVPGEGAGYGQDHFPDVVYGPPEAPGNGGGSLDVLSLGREGTIVMTFRGVDLVDGEGTDLLIFENPFTGWAETGIVGVSEDGENWQEWPCDTSNAADGYPGCAGVALVYSNSDNGIDARDPETAGGDRFDLADIGVSRAHYVRIRDSGANSYEGVSGGFDVDAVALLQMVAL